jgi:glycosyltransferase involved in cell wall biosynthesis
MRILFIVDCRIDSPGVGGAERSLREMIPYFRHAGIEPVVACFHRRGTDVDKDFEGSDEPPYPVYFLDGQRRFDQVRELRRIMTTERIDLVHTTLFQADVLGRMATLGTRLPVVTSLVNMPYERARLEHDRNANAPKIAGVRLLETVTGWLFANHFHAITRAVEEAAVAKRLVPPKRTTVVYRGRDERRLGRRSADRRLRVRRELGIPDSTFVILNVARQEYQKGQRVLVEAMRHVLDRNPDALLVIAGRDGNATADLKLVVNRGALRDRVRFLGHRDDAPDLMAAADVFALSSLWEGLGCVIIEALALELPIVASDLPPVREVLQDGLAGLLVPKDDPRALADGLIRIREDAGRASELTRTGRRIFEENFTLEQSARGMIGIFERVGRGDRRPRIDGQRPASGTAP